MYDVISRQHTATFKSLSTCYVANVTPWYVIVWLELSVGEVAVIGGSEVDEKWFGIYRLPRQSEVLVYNVITRVRMHLSPVTRE